MEEKVTAVYLVAWNSELKPEDGGSFERALGAQKEKCLEFVREKGIDESKVVFYRNRRDLFRDVERDRIERLIVNDLGRLAVTKGDMEGALYELKMRKVELLTVEGEAPAQ